MGWHKPELQYSWEYSHQRLIIDNLPQGQVLPVRSICASEPVGPVNKDALEAICNTARLANSLRDLTGMQGPREARHCRGARADCQPTAY